MASFFLFCVLPYLFRVCFSQPSAVINISSSSTVIINSSSSSVSMAGSIFYLNSSLPSMWYNNDSINMTIPGNDGSKVRVVLSRQRNVGFVCGFYCIDSCEYHLFSVVVVGAGNHSVVWSANRDHPVQENATLQLTQDGDLVLRDSDGSKVWSTNTTQKSVLGMNMTEAGNLVLFNNEETIVWQSFDNPTDSLLVGQRLYEGQRLTASSSKSNWSHGLYYSTWTSATGFAAYTLVDQSSPLMYFQMVPGQISGNTSQRSNYAEFQLDRSLVNVGILRATFGGYSLYFRSESVVYVRLDSEGHLKVYQHNSETGQTERADMVSQDLGQCQYPRTCGEYGVCREGQCNCPTSLDGVAYFQQTRQLPNQGCTRISPLSCQPLPDRHRLLEVRDVTYFNVIDPDGAFPGIRDIDGCKQACLQNCSCGALFFRYENSPSDGYCYMPPEVLSIREAAIPNHNFTSDTYIKVQIPYEAPSPLPGIVPPTPPSRNLAAIIAGSIAGAFVIVCIAAITLLMLRKRNADDEEDYIKQVPGLPKRFSYEDLRVATEDFKERLGAGGFGTVFKGMLGDGTKVAVKRLDKLSQGTREFLAEVESIGSIHHFNLVMLIGFCAEKSCRLLVFEYMSNGSLDKWIFRRDQTRLRWQVRKKIILDIAKGLAYLHEECRQRIIHLDIKPQNILLDENFNAKLSDFGLSKVIDRDESQVQTTMRGTPGYLAPEWRQLRITVKVDNYSFGIVVLEIVCGRRNLDRTRSESGAHLLGLLHQKAKEEQLLDIVENWDEEMQNHREEVAWMIKIGAWCLQDDHSRRPSMSTVVKVLEGVMEVEPNINYSFTHALASSVVGNGHVSTPPEASVLSNPR